MKSLIIMPRNIIYSVDVEPDLHSKAYFGIKKGLKEFEKVCDKYKVRPILFITADCAEKYPLIFKKFYRKGWDISLHGLSHKRFDDMSYEEKEHEIKKSIDIFKKNLGIRPKGFRAPQHSIDEETLDLLEKYGFVYDSSYTPLNLLQLIFFPKRFKLWMRGFFSPIRPYNIRHKLIEMPVSSLIIPFVSLTIRIFPLWLSKIYVGVIKLIYEKPIFYAHSWDFIELKESRIDKKFNHQNFIKKLGGLMEHESKN